MAMIRQCRLGMNGCLSLRRHARMHQSMGQRAMLRCKQQRNQRATQPFRTQGGTQQTAYVRKGIHGR